MAGIYIHIPFCKQACHYCDFHFSTTLANKNEVIKNILKEIKLRKDYLDGKEIETIYFGGGTPSLLTQPELNSILDTIHQHFNVKENIECTLEANPDDINPNKLKEIKDAGINRLSIGVQSFFDEDLLYMNRSHDAKHAEACISLVQEAGFENFSMDLIFGFPLLTNEKWEQNVATALKYKVPHLSCYAMTVEPKTALASFIKTKKTLPINQEQSATQFEYLMKVLQTNNYEHYEISNYALPNHRALHNSNYWSGSSYLGIGPSAHSFNGDSRQWNIANNSLYGKSLHEDIIPFEKEILTEEQKLNEQIMTALRTMEGLESAYIKNRLSEEVFKKWTQNTNQQIREGLIFEESGFLKLTQNGKLFADYVAGELFV